MARPVPGDASDYPDIPYPDEDAQRPSDDDADVVDDDDMAGGPPTPQCASMPPPPRRSMATPQRGHRGKPEYHSIGSPPSQRSDRSRTERGTPAPRRVLADPPSAVPSPAHPPQRSAGEPTLSEVLAAITIGQKQHPAEISAVLSQQRVQTEAIEELAQRTESLEAAAAASKSAADSLADRVSALEARSRAGSSAASSVPSTSGGDPFHIDRSVMRISAKSMVAKDALETALRPLLQAASVAKGEVRLEGSAVGKMFTLRALPGGLRAPEDTIRNILDARRLPSGE